MRVPPNEFRSEYQRIEAERAQRERVRKVAAWIVIWVLVTVLVFAVAYAAAK